MFTWRKTNLCVYICSYAERFRLFGNESTFNDALPCCYIFACKNWWGNMLAGTPMLLSAIGGDPVPRYNSSGRPTCREDWFVRRWSRIAGGVQIFDWFALVVMAATVARQRRCNGYFTISMSSDSETEAGTHLDMISDPFGFVADGFVQTIKADMR